MNNRVKTINFQDYNILNTDFILKNRLDHNALESILAYLATLTQFNYLEDGKIDSKSYINQNFKRDAWHIGLYNFLMTSTRGDIIFGKQISKENLPYCGLVPLVLAAHKKYNDIPYNNWSLEGLNIIVNKQLYDIMALKGSAPSFDAKYLTELRDIGLIVKKEDSPKYGNRKNPKTHYGLSGISKISHPEFASLPKLAQIMLTQTWAAHPDNRNKYMILDLNDWDNIPEPLEPSDIFEDEKSNTLSKFNELDLPWKF